MAPEPTGERLARLEGKLDTAHAELGGKLDTLKATIEAGFETTATTIDFGDRANATLIAAVDLKADKAHERLDDIDKRRRTFQVLIVSAFVFPMAVTIIGIILVAQLGSK